ncbi:MAG: aconitase family protein [Planctomyces sp.]
MLGVRLSFGARSTFSLNGTTYTYFSLAALSKAKIGKPIASLPYSIRVILESMLRSVDGTVVTADDVSGLASYDAKKPAQEEIPFMVGRVVLQDFTGVPCVVDLAAMREAMKALGGDPSAINPLVPCDLVIDHSVQVDAFGAGEGCCKRYVLILLPHEPRRPSTGEASLTPETTRSGLLAPLGTRSSPPSRPGGACPRTHAPEPAPATPHCSYSDR